MQVPSVCVKLVSNSYVNHVNFSAMIVEIFIVKSVIIKLDILNNVEVVKVIFVCLMVAVSVVNVCVRLVEYTVMNVDKRYVKNVLIGAVFEY